MARASFHTGTRRPQSTKAREFMTLARARFKQAMDAEDQQRTRETEDLRFYAGDQWPTDIRASRAGQEASGSLPPVPARPCITINKTRAPVRQVLNQERQSDLGLQIVPADDFGALPGPIDKTEIELREGLVRKIQRDSHAQDARTWAFSRAVIAGRGYYGVMTRYLPGKTFDQEIYDRRFYDQASVTLDPSHEQPDGSDAEWGFVGTNLPYDEYVSQYGEDAEGKPNAVKDSSDDEFRAFNEQAPGWFTTTEDGEKQTRMCRVVEYWYTARTTRTLILLSTGEAAWEDEFPKFPTGITRIGTRRVEQKSIKFAKLDGYQVLEETDWEGKYIPIIKVLGEELHPYDKERRVEGMVRPASEANRGFNYMLTKEVEMIGLAPVPPWMMAEGQAEGYESWYQVANTRNLPYLYYKQTDLEGRLAAPPTRTDVNVPIQHLAMAIAQFSEAVKDTTAVPDASLGNVDPSIKSGRAIRALIDQSLRGNSNFLDNLARSVTYEGRIINDLLYPIYGRRPGRIAQMMTGNGDIKPVMVGQPFVEQDGKPIPAQPGQPEAQTFQLTKDADFNIAVKVTKAYDTRREQEAAELGEILAAAPQLMAVIGDIYFKNQDGPGSQEIAERMKLVLDPKVQQGLDGKKPLPPEAQAQMQQLQQALEMTTQELEAKNQMIETDQIKAQRTYAEKQLTEKGESRRAGVKAQLDARKIEADERQAALDNLVKLAIAELNAETALSKVHAEQARDQLGFQHEHQESERDRQIQTSEAERNRTTQMTEAERDRQASQQQPSA